MAMIQKELAEFRKRQIVGRAERKIMKAVEAVGFFIPFDAKSKGFDVIFNPNRRRQDEFRFRSRLDNLVRKGLIVRVKHSNKSGYKLTEKGEETAERYALGELALEKPWRWDGKWRVVMFDIPEKKRGSRDELRAVLQTIGFENLQKSVWIYPYDCQDAIELIRRKYELGKHLRYLTVDEIDFDLNLREVFNLR